MLKHEDYYITCTFWMDWVFNMDCFFQFLIVKLSDDNAALLWCTKWLSHNKQIFQYFVRNNYHQADLGFEEAAASPEAEIKPNMFSFFCEALSLCKTFSFFSLWKYFAENRTASKLYHLTLQWLLYNQVKCVNIIRIVLLKGHFHQRLMINLKFSNALFHSNIDVSLCLSNQPSISLLRCFIAFQRFLSS